MSLHSKQFTVKKAVFPVGGLGTRFLPATKSIPKEMLPVGNKPLIQHAFEEAKQAGIEQFIFITGRNKSVINNHFDRVFELEAILQNNLDGLDILQSTKDWLPSPGNTIFIRQQETLGLGHAVWCARNVIGDEPFAVLLADDFFLSSIYNGTNCMFDMIQAYKNLGEYGASLVAVSSIESVQSSRYGIIRPSNEHSNIIIDMVEKPDSQAAPSNLAIVGRYILQPEIFHYLEHVEKGVGGEVQLTDAMRFMLKHHDYYFHEIRAKRIDCGHYLGFLEANLRFALQCPAFNLEAKALLRQITQLYEDE